MADILPVNPPDTSVSMQYDVRVLDLVPQAVTPEQQMVHQDWQELKNFLTTYPHANPFQIGGFLRQRGFSESESGRNAMGMYMRPSTRRIYPVHRTSLESNTPYFDIDTLDSIIGDAQSNLEFTTVSLDERKMNSSRDNLMAVLLRENTLGENGNPFINLALVHARSNSDLSPAFEHFNKDSVLHLRFDSYQSLSNLLTNSSEVFEDACRVMDVPKDTITPEQLAAALIVRFIAKTEGYGGPHARMFRTPPMPDPLTRRRPDSSVTLNY